MGSFPLVSQKIEAGERFLVELAKAMPVRAAFWLREAEGPTWLYVVTDLAIAEDDDLGYGPVVRVGMDFDDPWFSLSEVKVISTQERLGAAALTVQAKRGGRAHRIVDTSFGGVGVDEVYLYPASLLATVP